MYAEPKKLWMAALRGGKYPQTKGSLHDDKGYCCLGVLCEVAIEQGIDIQRGETSVIEGIKPAQTYDNEAGILPLKVMEWAGIADGYGIYRDSNNERETLVNLNDSGESFTSIADTIEEYF